MTERVPLPDIQKPRTWRQQMALTQVDKTTFRSTMGSPHGPFFLKNGEQRPRAFGGHVYAQAVYAASKTVDPVFVIHSVTGYFTELGLADEPFIYTITVIRDGKNYSVRKVDASQSDGKVTFTNICSFKRTEDFVNIQVPQDMVKKYSQVFGGRKPEELPLKSSFKDLRQVREAYGSNQACLTTTFPGMITSILPLEQFHHTQIPIKRENIYVYSGISDDNEQSDANLDACAHMYHSDRESVWGMVRQFELLDVLDSAASLSHTVIFHTGADQIIFKDKNGNRRWFFLETGAERISDGRGLHQGKIYDADGNHVATTLQDGAIRLRWKKGEDKKRRYSKLEEGSKL